VVAAASTVSVRLCQHLAVCLVLLVGCRAPTPEAEQQQGDAPACPTQQVREIRAPDVRPEHERAGYWLREFGPPAEPGPPGSDRALDHDAELLDAESRSLLASSVAKLPGGWRDPTGPDGADPELVETERSERLTWLRERLASGKYIETTAGALERAAERITAATAVEGPALRFVVSETQLWCVPSHEGLYSEPVGHGHSPPLAVPIDLDFDRNRCASLHPGDLVRALRTTPDGTWLYVDAGHTVGWVEIGQPITLGPALTPEAARAQLDAQPRAFILDDFEALRAGSSFPLHARDDDSLTIGVPSIDGTIERELPRDAPVHVGALSFTRRAVFTQAFALLEQPYGWGGRDGHRDCSSYLLDLFAQFDVKLPRNSAVQAQLGTRSVDLSELDEADKTKLIRMAAREGVVLLYMPGHIMLYLGRDGDHDYALSALSEYLTPCPGGPDVVHRLDKVAVTTLELGRGTERRAFIERITRMAVFGPMF
jgi:hypothetical protein